MRARNYHWCYLPGPEMKMSNFLVGLLCPGQIALCPLPSGSRLLSEHIVGSANQERHPCLEALPLCTRKQLEYDHSQPVLGLHRQHLFKSGRELMVGSLSFTRVKPLSRLGEEQQAAGVQGWMWPQISSFIWALVTGDFPQPAS